MTRNPEPCAAVPAGATSLLNLAVPCPGCGYDLRGHPDLTRCPECGRTVHVGGALAEANHWIDLKLLDLWSIGLLEGIAAAAAAATLVSIRLGHYVALLSGMLTALCVSTATVWFVAVLPAILWRCRRPLEMAVGGRRLGRIRRLLLIDGVLVLAMPIVFTILLQ